MLDRPEEFERMAPVEADLWWYNALHAQVEEAVPSGA